jgi:hypothetical protein
MEFIICNSHVIPHDLNHVCEQFHFLNNFISQMGVFKKKLIINVS